MTFYKLYAKFLKFLYWLIPLKIGFGRLYFWIWKLSFSMCKNGILLILKMKNPKFFIKLDIRDRIQFITYIDGKYTEPDTQALFRNLIEPKSCIVDIGANIGYYSLMAAAISPDSEIFAFEPLPKNVTAFKENISLNNYSNIHVEEVALSDEDGIGALTLMHTDTESGWAHLLAKLPDDSGKYLKVKRFKLDTICKTLKIPSVDILKIDVEGHDFQVIKGAGQTLGAPGKRHCIIEFNDYDFQNHGIISQGIDEFLKEKGYKLFSIKKNGKITPIDKPFGGSKEMNFYYLKEQ